jgi:SagB-type dehydrogenase family enzyme
MTVAVKQALSPTEVTLAYHTRTKHSLERYAAGPETLDWDMQPNPFREFAGCARTPLALVADQVGTSLTQVYLPQGVRPASLTIASVGALLELSMGLSAWKEYGPDRWALRCNPSSGNLHPTEAYLISENVPGLDDGLYHYLSREHTLEQRCRNERGHEAPARLWIGLTSVHWREAWKYGERAFRYCQLDIGHALGAIRYAAGALGWTAKVVDEMGADILATLMGLDRLEDFSGVEREDADLLIAINAHPGTSPDRRNSAPNPWEPATSRWTGQANLLEPRPVYRWPVIDQVSTATQTCGVAASSATINYPALREGSETRVADIILGRRSAQRFDRTFTMSTDVFYRLLDGLLARPIAPWDVWDFAPRIHPIFLVHRVEGLEPGLYALPRHPGVVQSLRGVLRLDFEWQTSENTPAHLPLVRLLPADCRVVAKTVNCHQAIATDGCFAVSMLSEFEPIIKSNVWHYRQLHWEAGLLGHVLYLEAEAAGLRGTGIGCYFDDAMHDVLGLETTQFQALYHFTVGRPLTDDRITTLPAYPGRERQNRLKG